MEASTGVNFDSNLVDEASCVIAVTNQQVTAMAPAASLEYLEYVAKVKPISKDRLRRLGKYSGRANDDRHAGREGYWRLFAASVAVTATPPVVELPLDITAEATGAAGAVVDFSVQAADIAGEPLTTVSSPVSGTTFPLGKTTVTSATDSLGNTSIRHFPCHGGRYDATGTVGARECGDRGQCPGGSQVTLPEATATDV